MELDEAAQHLDHLAEPTPELVARAIELTTADDPRLRDWACFVLGQLWLEVDTPELRAALTARLDDTDHDTRCEALIGLANRRSASILPRVIAALSRDDDSVWRLEMLAAGTLGDPALHPLVLRHQEGWDGADVRTMDVVRRLTDPAGPGEDMIDGVADLYRRRAHGLEDGDAIEAWHLMDELLDIAPWRGRELLDQVISRLAADPAAQEEVRQRSVLARIAAEEA
jgi:hypothetical protein